ncbi:LysR family transcriptional regulator [Salinivibrio kushneri]|uniref:LysR family transcriptional regulator n=2 Tax=Salinivibrio kushneri TaxID=1908198 RepID=UPI0009850679|nr:LysR family transcriptional regulator [Salinivibrio kushneri]OOE48873.1 LysR family transcriptional regulator [Salinivibrio kushneri]OOE60879.1 LysR family transcriptional regulator [Salinivibrio kushneri]
MDRLTAIRSFVEVANCKSFTRAAEQLGLTRLQVSRHVQEVEQWLSQRLLHRTTRKVSLTYAGEQAYGHCQRILDEAAALTLTTGRLQGALTGRIRVAAPIGLAQGILVAPVTQFTDAHPEVVIEVIASDQFTPLVDERVDIALRFTPQPDEHLIARKLMAIDSIVCASSAYIAHASQPNYPSDLSDHPCLIHVSGDHWQFIKDSRREEVRVSGPIHANDLGTLVNAARMGKGIVRVPCDLANPYVEQGELIPLLTDYRLPPSALWAVYLSRSYQQPVVRHFIDHLASCWQHDIQAPIDGSDAAHQ